jgi:(p)ppGpp synthase/HD superfamily hydrolase
MNNITIASQFAKEKHILQFRKYTNQPYIIHPTRVFARAFLFEDITEQELCACWLHDTIEDCKVKYEEIVSIFPSEQFGIKVATYVQNLTNPSKFLSKKTSREERKKIDCAHYEKLDNKTKRIKLIDRWDNCLDLYLAPYDFIKLYFGETKKLLNVIGDACPEIHNDIIKQLNLLEDSARIFHALQKIG